MESDETPIGYLEMKRPLNVLRRIWYAISLRHAQWNISGDHEEPYLDDLRGSSHLLILKGNAICTTGDKAATGLPQMFKASEAPILMDSDDEHIR